MKKRVFTLLLCLCMVVVMLPSTVAATSKTADEAIAWANSQVGHSVGRDDGTGYYQCIEYIQAYYQWLGVQPVGGNGADYAYNALPSGWTRTAGGTPQKGDILIYSGSPGHVAIYESDSVYYDQNGNKYGATVEKQYQYYRTPGYWGCIHPDFSGVSAQPSVTFSAWNNDRYTYIRETDAAIGQLINVSNGICTDTGMYLYDANGKQLATANNGVYDVPQVYFKMNEECRYTLTPGTTYKYKFYAIVNGQTYWSNEGSFTTKGPTPAPTPAPTPTPTPTPTPPANDSKNSEAEVNDTIERANSISVNTEISGSISKSSDVDWFVFQVPNDGHISITFDHDFVDCYGSCWETSFYTSDNKELNSWTWKGKATTAGTGNANGIPAGTYYLRVSNYNDFSPATYRFKVNYTASDSWEKEFNETIVTANKISTGTEISGSVRNSSDEDWFVFQVPSDGYISLTFSHDYVNCYGSCWETSFYTSDNKELNSWTWNGKATTAETGNANGIPAGTYYLCVSNYNDFSPATYRFKVNYTPSSSWEKEFNETFVTANKISTGTEISGSIRNSSDVDWYTFELSEAGMISLTFSHDYVNCYGSCWETSFYTSDNKELNSWTWKGRATSTETGSMNGVPAGTYYLRVSNYNDFSPATYRFTVNDNLSGQKPAVTGIALNKSNISLAVGTSSVLTAQVTPANATDKTFVWKSENTAVATVSNGRVTAVREGSTRITASYGNISAACTVTVTAKGEQPQIGGVHFERVNTYFQDQFTDVPANQWYTDNVANAFEFGLMVGDSKTKFNPYGNVTIAQVVTMASRIHSIFTKGYEDFQQTGSKWYQVYMDYAYENGIISQAYYNCDASQSASRAQFAEIFANSLPAEGLTAINSVSDGAIPDVSMENRYAEYIYKLYRAGILTGSDANGTFNPTTYITRAEAATIVSRMAESDNRVSITLR